MKFFTYSERSLNSKINNYANNSSFLINFVTIAFLKLFRKIINLKRNHDARRRIHKNRFRTENETVPAEKKYFPARTF